MRNPKKVVSSQAFRRLVESRFKRLNAKPKRSHRDAPARPVKPVKPVKPEDDKSPTKAEIEALRKGDILFVVWVDAQSRDEWTTEKELEPDIPHAITTGMFVKQGRDAISVAGTWTGNPEHDDCQFCCVMQIPKRWIIQMGRMPFGGRK
jgi:hypothetical protein